MTAVIAVSSGFIALATPPTASANTCPPGTYQAASGDCVESPDQNPGGRTAICRDGTDSHSETRSGTCSRHGGVAQWCPCGGAAATYAPAAAPTDDSIGAAINSYLNTHGLNYRDVPGSRDAAANLAYDICIDLDSGQTGSREIVQLMNDTPANKFPSVEYNRLNATVLVNAAVAVVCPWNSAALG
jgi:hypothetical protein